MNGTVLFFNHTYGFIRSPKVPRDIYFHYKDILSSFYKELTPGDFVEFELEEKEDGYTAKLIKQITELENGKRIIRAKLFKIQNQSFDLMEFYNSIVTRINSGLKHATIIENYIVASSEKLDEATLLSIINKQKDRHIFFDDKIVKIIN